MSTRRIGWRANMRPVLLVDEFQRGGVEIIFLNRALGRSPEDDLLLGIVKLLGMIWSPGNRRHFPEAMATDPL